MDQQSSNTAFAVVLSILLLLVGASPTPVRAQIPVVGYLWLGEPPPPGAPSPFSNEMKSLGHIEGRTYVLEARYARGDNSRLRVLAREIVDRRPAVIVSTCGVQLKAIREFSATVPVIAGCADPRNFLGEVASLSRPGGRTTGYTFLAPESAAKRLQLLKELQPRLSRVGVLLQPSDDWGSYLQEMEPAAAKLGLTLSKLPIARPEEVDDVFATVVRQRTDALVVLPDSTTTGAAARIVALAKLHKILTIFDLRFFVDQGGLISYGPTWYSDGSVDRLIAAYIDKILKGAAPGELPIQQPTRLELVINLATARALGLTVPHSILLRADAVIE